MNTREARPKTWIPTRFEIQDNSTISTGFLSPTATHQDRAQDAYRRFVEDPNHPGLRLKRVHPTEPVYSVRISQGYRALGVRVDDTMVWFWIGSHADYDGLISRM